MAQRILTVTYNGAVIGSRVTVGKFKFVIARVAFDKDAYLKMWRECQESPGEVANRLRLAKLYLAILNARPGDEHPSKGRQIEAQEYNHARAATLGAELTIPGIEARLLEKSMEFAATNADSQPPMVYGWFMSEMRATKSAKLNRAMTPWATFAVLPVDPVEWPT